MTSSSNLTFTRQYSRERPLSRRQLLKLLGTSAVSGFVLGACAEAPGSGPGLTEVSVPIGSYTTVQVSEPCGLAGGGRVIGAPDDPASFRSVERAAAQILWFGLGFVEYTVPGVAERDGVLESLELSMELCSETTLHNNVYPSDITLWLNGTAVGTWTSPGDFGGRPGRYTPSAWWDNRFTQYGQLKTWRVSAQGSYLDGVRVSDVTLQDLKLTGRRTFALRLGVAEDARNVGGINLFGKGFGDYGQGVTVKFQSRSG